MESLKSEWTKIQNELVSQRITTDVYSTINFVAGCDISFYKENNDDAVVCIVVMKYPSLEIVYSTCRKAFREADLIINLIKEIPQEVYPDLLLIDGNGTLHPLKFGIACHLGVVLNIPTIGVAKNFLQIAQDGLFLKDIKEKSKKLTSPGDFFEIVGKSKFVYGAALIPVKNCSNPIFVSPGNRISLGMAIEFVVKTSKFRVPEPIRQADFMSRQKVKTSLPHEVNDDILLNIGDLDLAMQWAIQFKRFWAAGRIYNYNYNAVKAAKSKEYQIDQGDLMNIIRYLDIQRKGDAFLYASKKGYDKVVTAVLSDPQIDPSCHNNYAVKITSTCGYDKVVKLLLADPRVDPSAADNYAIRFASYNGKFETVKELLSDPRSDPSAKNNEAIQMASMGGHDKVVELLLSDPRTDPSDMNNYPICISSRKGKFDVVKLLLADPRVDPSVYNNQVICFASIYGNLEVVKLLLSDPRVDPSADNNAAIRIASANGNFDVVKLLLSDPKVDPSARDNFAIRMASANGHDKVVELLLSDPRINPSAKKNYSIRMASANGHDKVVGLLLSVPRVKPVNEAIRLATLNGHSTVVKLLVSDSRARVDTFLTRPKTKKKVTSDRVK